MPEAISILIVDDHDMFISGLIALLADVNHIKVLATGTNGEEAIELVQQHPDAHLLIMDISMPTMDGIKATQELKQQGSTIPILALTQNSDSGTILQATKAGLRALASKKVRHSRSRPASPEHMF